MKNRILFSAICILISYFAHSQVKVTGQISDLKNHEIGGVTILAHSDKGVDAQQVSNKKGEFSITLVKSTNYELRFSHVGYENQVLKIKTGKTDLDLGFLEMKPGASTLSEVTVRSKKTGVKQKADTLEFAASAFKVNPDASAEDLVRKMPGIGIEDGTVKAQGEEVKKVTIDGKEFFGDDATAALKNLPAEIIEKIQVFDRMSDNSTLTGFDDGNASKSINIITKAEMKNGRFGRIAAGYGTGNTYNAGGNLSYYSGRQRISLLGLANNVNQQNFSSQDIIGISQSSGKKNKAPKPDAGKNASNFSVGPKTGINNTTATGVNFSDSYGKKLELTASYFFNHSENSNTEKSTRNSFLGADSSLQYQEDRQSSSSGNTHRVNIRAEYRIDSANTLLLTSKDHFQDKNSQEKMKGSNSVSGSQPTYTMGWTSGAGKGQHLDNSLIFKHQFARPGRTMVIEYGDQRDKTSSNKRLINFSGETEIADKKTDIRRQNAIQEKLSEESSLDLSYTEPLGRKSLMLLHFSSKAENSLISQNSFALDQNLVQSMVPDSSLSSVFKSRYFGHQGGVGYKLGAKENQLSLELDYRAGSFNGENVYKTSSMKKDYFNLLPALNWKMRVSPASSIKVELHSSVDLPAIDQLQAAIDVSEPLFFSQGNSSLVQQTSQKLSGRYTYINLKNGTSFFANFSAQKAENFFTNASFIASADTLVGQGVVLKKGGQILMPVNMDGYFNMKSVLSFSLPLKRLATILTWTGGLQMTHTPGIVNGTKNISEARNLSSGLTVSSNISSFIDFNISYSGNLSSVENSIQAGTNSYLSQITSVKINLLSPGGWLFQNDLTNQSYSGLTQGFNQQFCSWNVSAGKKFLKKQAGELKLSVFDLLKQNRSISRMVTETYIEDSRNLVLQQYFMLTFTYRFKAFGSNK